MTSADNERVDIARKGSSNAWQNRRRSSRFLEIVLPLLGGLGIAILAALIMRYV